MEKQKIKEDIKIYHVNANKKKAMMAILISKIVNRIQGTNQ